MAPRNATDRLTLARVINAGEFQETSAISKKRGSEGEQQRSFLTNLFLPSADRTQPVLPPIRCDVQLRVFGLPANRANSFDSAFLNCIEGLSIGSSKDFSQISYHRRFFLSSWLVVAKNERRLINKYHWGCSIRFIWLRAIWKRSKNKNSWKRKKMKEQVEDVMCLPTRRRFLRNRSFFFANIPTTIVNDLQPIEYGRREERGKEKRKKEKKGKRAGQKRRKTEGEGGKKR